MTTDKEIQKELDQNRIDLNGYNKDVIRDLF
jgi:hypothetical protein